MFKKFLWISAFSLISKASLASYLSLGGEITDEASKKSVSEWVERMQLPAAPKDQIPSEVWDSWNNLESYTQQTLENFKNGDPRGIIMVHGFEDEWLADRKFIESWNQAYPGKELSFEGSTENYEAQRKTALPISEEDFIKHYTNFVLKHRYNIATSLLSFHENKNQSSCATFATCGLILVPSPENILITSRADCFSYAQYSNGLTREESKPDTVRKNLEEREIKFSIPTKLYSLDTLVRYPLISGPAQRSGTMGRFNEVVISACTKDPEQKEHVLKIAGIFINNSSEKPTLVGKDYYERTKVWRDAARAYALKKKLPLIEFNSDDYILEKYKTHPGEVMPNFVEFFDGKVPLQAGRKYPEQLKKEKTDFRFTPEMLEGYGLKAVEKNAS